MSAVSHWSRTSARVAESPGECVLAEAGRRALRYRLVVVAADPVDVVTWAGGWLFDRAAEGWEVTVAVESPVDVRPLAILGLGVADLGCVLSCRQQLPAPQAFSIAGEVSALGVAAREWAERYMRSARTEVRFWGDIGYGERAFPHSAPTRYVPTRAAAAFKGYALDAAGVRSAAEFESFRAVAGSVAGPGVRTRPAG